MSLKTRLIGVTGRAQHGKDTFGRIAISTMMYKRAAFADQLKGLALLTDPLIPVDHEEDSQVGGLIYSVQHLRLSNVVAAVGWEAAKSIPEVRRYLQVLGTEVRNVIGPDAWVSALEADLENRGILAGGHLHDYVVVTDVRFPNEAEWIHTHGGVLVRVTRYNEDGTVFAAEGVDPNHPSEALVPLLNADIELANYDLKSYENAAWKLLDQGVAQVV